MNFPSGQISVNSISPFAEVVTEKSEDSSDSSRKVRLRFPARLPVPLLRGDGLVAGEDTGVMFNL
jgi:hypothetical protein